MHYIVVRYKGVANLIFKGMPTWEINFKAHFFKENLFSVYDLGFQVDFRTQGRPGLPRHKPGNAPGKIDKPLNKYCSYNDHRNEHMEELNVNWDDNTYNLIHKNCH
jgi:hypothetical protein